MILLGFADATWKEYQKSQGKYFQFFQTDEIIEKVFFKYYEEAIKAEDLEKKNRFDVGVYFEKTDNTKKIKLGK